MNFNDIARIVRPIAQKIDRVITRGVVTKVNNDGVNEFNPGSGDSPQLVSIEGMPGDIYTEIPRYQSYGHESYPAKDAEAVLLAPSGESENSFIIVIQDISLRPTDLAETEVTDYGPLDDAGATIPTYQRVHFKADGSVEIRAGKNNLIKFTKDGKLELTVDDNFEVAVASGKKIVLGDGTNEVLSLLNDLITEFKTLVSSSILGGSNSVDLGGAASTGALFKVAGALATMETNITTIQTALGSLKE